LSPKIDDNVANKMLFLLSALVFMHLGVILAGISSKILNIRVFISYNSHKLSPSY